MNLSLFFVYINPYCTIIIYDAKYHMFLLPCLIMDCTYACIDIDVPAIIRLYYTFSNDLVEKKVIAMSRPPYNVKRAKYNYVCFFREFNISL